MDFEYAYIAGTRPLQFLSYTVFITDSSQEQRVVHKTAFEVNDI